ncbi:MAG: hypothetical protein FJ297_06035 [Planctomycetes bacterium]|nr:hypothetical protein [Planctomycetota bacterium]
MDRWNGWDIGLGALFVYVAVVTLTRMMNARREALIRGLRRSAGSNPVEVPVNGQARAGSGGQPPAGRT